ncbi:MAG: zinc ribbon domain-containing protein [Gammaproteobacteria bacterium]|nr:zinc ribbon domain-containing protein [Gammaproteobacteria bacterium]MXW19345.1 zinc ribbon domain-containing protein [Gammaproteobacteria bacterium]MXZ28865.1 zinc ribbon domain-containing protein [Gammaproteobacteria bacterium]MYF58407.1 zinc ribbon domain-containing protein [Gammaproteobacteria bacterium]
MPIYEYECRECGYRLDALQKMSDPLLSDCPECERPGLKKLVSAPHFRLKGSGWYETDFKNSGRDRQDDAGKDAGNGASKAASGKETDGGKDKAGSSPGKESGAKPASDAAAA